MAGERWEGRGREGMTKGRGAGGLPSPLSSCLFTSLRTHTHLPRRGGMSLKVIECASVCISLNEAHCSPNSQGNYTDHSYFEIHSSFNRSICRIVLNDILNISRNLINPQKLTKGMSTGRCKVYQYGLRHRNSGAGRSLSALVFQFPECVSRQHGISPLCINQ